MDPNKIWIQIQNKDNKTEDIPGFVFLEPKDDNIHEHHFEKQLVERSDKKRALSAAKFLSDFHTVLAECIQGIGDIRKTVTETDLHTDYLIKLRRHGPAIQMDVYLNTPLNAEVGDEVLGEKERNEAECDGVRQSATACDEKMQDNRNEKKWEDGLEIKRGEGEISRQNGRNKDEIKNTNENADEEAISVTGEEGDTDSSRLKENSKGNYKEVSFKFRLATKDVIGRKELSKLKKFCSVDIVPTLHVPSVDHNTEGEYYVAKPVKGHEDRIEELQSAWRRSFSLEAKKKLKCADNENTCKKMLFRILKAIRNRECGLLKMNTYHLKNALLKELDGHTDNNEEDKYWSVNSLAERFTNVLERLIKEYEPGNKMSEYFIQEIDLLEHMEETTRENIHCRLKRLRNSEKQMMRVLEGRKPRKRRPRKKQASAEPAYGLSTGI